MKSSKNRIAGLLVLVTLILSCGTGGTDVQPIVIDLSATKAPSPAASPTAAAAPTPVPSPPTATASPAPPAFLDPSGRPPAEVAQSRVDACNRRDLETLISLYAPDARLYEPPDHLRDSGIKQIRQTYERRFASAPGARITVAQRMTEGPFVVDREVEAGTSVEPSSAIVISEIREGKIVRVWTLR